jgi:hypothetical protein
VLALIRSEDPDEEVRANAEENLKDFLRDGKFDKALYFMLSSLTWKRAGSHKFVEEVFAAVKSKSFILSNSTTSDALPGAPFNPPTGPSFNPPTGPSAQVSARSVPDLAQSNASQPIQPIRNRKRSYHERDADDYPHGQFSSSPVGPASKFLRRGNQRMAAARGGAPNLPVSAVSYSPVMNGHGVPPLQGVDLNSTIPAMMAQIQAMGAILSGMSSGAYPDGLQHGRGRGRRCFDYDTKGFCARGSTCPYEHGTNSVVMPHIPVAPQYPSFNSSHGGSQDAGDSPNANFQRPMWSNGNTRNRGGRGGRASFSSVGRNLDQSITTIVIENIPEANFTEDQVREFFSQFGSIAEINMQPYKRLALVKYDEYSSARKAYESPKTIFDNRFVKVFWYKPKQSAPSASSDNQQSLVRQSSSTRSEDELQQAQEFEKKVAEAQRKHEEKMKSIEEAKSKKAELDHKIKEHAEETKKLLQAIAAKEKQESDGNGEASNDSKEAQDNEELKAKVARLEAEAQSLGLDPDNPYGTNSSYTYPGRGRGDYRGRAWQPRGRGYRRGFGFGGRGGNPNAIGSVLRLDNRPKKVSVSISAGSPQDETLRSYLFVSRLPIRAIKV